jgi:23S rRNA pseudouridine955/2504/2580 synthase
MKKTFQPTEYTVVENDHEMRLDRLCKQRFHMPNSLCQKSCRKGLIRLDGAKCKANDRVALGQVITFKMNLDDLALGQSEKSPRKRLSRVEIEQAQSWVVYKDEDILVLDKPAGLAVQGGSKVSHHLDALLPALVFDADETPRLVHRLDKDTSGLLLLARHVRAARALQKLFVSHALQKTYLALVIDVPHPLQGVIKTSIEKMRTPEDPFEKMHPSEQGKWAKTEYEVCDYMTKTVALVALKPITGRTHQLRVHMASIGCPIVGDRKYARRGAARHLNLEHEKTLHLHAWRTTLPACMGKPARHFQVPVPNEMQHSINEFGLERS